jgi:hypothetical protein
MEIYISIKLETVLHGLGLSSEVKSDEAAVANDTTITGTDSWTLLNYTYRFVCMIFIYLCGIVHVESNDPFDFV